MNSLLHLLAIWLLIIAPIARAQTTQPETLQQKQKEEEQRMLSELNALPELESLPIREAVKLRVEDEELMVDSALPTTEGSSRIKLSDMPGIAMVNVQTMQAGNEKARSFQMIHHDYTRPDVIAVRTSIFAMPNHLQIARDIEMPHETRSISLIQTRQFPGDQEPGVRLIVQGHNEMTGEQTINLQLQANTIVEMHRRYPRELAEHLQPVFRDLQQESVVFSVDSFVAWQVFAAKLPADESLASRVSELVARLGSDVFRDREAAFKSLEQMGQPAVPHLAKIDRAKLSAEQISRIDTLLAPYRPLSNEEAENLLQNPHFLLDCLYSDDERIRSVAHAQLEHVLEREIPFEPTMEKPQRVEAIAQFRNELQKQPVTQPATKVKPDN